MITKQEQKILVFFAAFWSAIEVSVGTILSLSKMPFRGFLLSSITCFFLISFRYIVDKPRTSLYLASIVAIVKLIFSFGAGGLNSALAIFLEGLIAEYIFSSLGINLISSSLVGGFIVLYPFVHGIAAQTLVFGADFIKFYNIIFRELQMILGKTINLTILELIMFFAMVYVIIGIIVGTISFFLAKKIIGPIIIHSKENGLE